MPSPSSNKKKGQEMGPSAAAAATQPIGVVQKELTTTTTSPQFSPPAMASPSASNCGGGDNSPTTTSASNSAPLHDKDDAEPYKSSPHPATTTPAPASMQGQTPTNSTKTATSKRNSEAEEGEGGEMSGKNTKLRVNEKRSTQAEPPTAAAHSALVEVKRSISSPYLSMFPARPIPSSATASNISDINSAVAGSHSDSRIEEKAISPSSLLIDHAVLMEQLDAATKFAFADLLVTVLRLDFYREAHQSSVEFCHSALELVLKWSQLPERTQSTLRHHMLGDEGWPPDEEGEELEEDLEEDGEVGEVVEQGEEVRASPKKSAAATSKEKQPPSSPKKSAKPSQQQVPKPTQRGAQLPAKAPPPTPHPAHSLNDDIGSLITTIKSDPLLLVGGEEEEGHNGGNGGGKVGGGAGPLVLVGSLLAAIVEGGDYDSRYRVVMRHVCALLGILWDSFEELEDTLTDRIIGSGGKEINEESESTRQARERRERLKRYKRYALIGAATGVGGVLIGLTSGLAAPMIASGITAMGLGAVPTVTTLTSTVFGSIFGAAGAGLTGYRMQKRVGAIEEFMVEPLTDTDKEASLHCVLCVSGWIDDANDSQAFRRQWRHLWMSKEQYTLRYESRYLEEWGKAMEYFLTIAVTYAIQRSLMETALAGLLSAVAWPLVLISSSSIIDNPWNVCFSRAAEVGQQLAEVLLARAHGQRPITLIGFSLGARVIFHCLLAMAKRKDVPNTGIIEDVVLLGAPVTASPKQWRQICEVVGGRVINGYCQSDWLLRFLYRTASIQFTIAGTGPVDNRRERKIFNFNLSHIIKGHAEYARKLTEVLDVVGVRVTPLSRHSRSDLIATTAADEEAGEEPTRCQSTPPHLNEAPQPQGAKNAQKKIGGGGSEDKGDLDAEVVEVVKLKLDDGERRARNDRWDRNGGGGRADSERVGNSEDKGEKEQRVHDPLRASSSGEFDGN